MRKMSTLLLALLLLFSGRSAFGQSAQTVAAAKKEVDTRHPEFSVAERQTIVRAVTALSKGTDDDRAYAQLRSLAAVRHRLHRRHD